MLLKDNLMNDWINFLDNGDMAAYIIKEVEAAEKGKGYLRLTCRAEETVRKCWANYYNTSLPQLIGTGNSLKVQVIIQFINSRVFNVKMGFSIKPGINRTPMIADDFIYEDVKCEISDSADRLIVETDALKLVINKNCFDFAVYDSGGELVTRHAPYDLSAGNGDGPSCDSIPTAVLKNLHTGKLSVCDSYIIDYDEHFYGFGERGSSLDAKGLDIPVWAYDCVGNHTPRMYKGIPFFMSSKGYGIYVNTSAPTRFDMGQWSFVSYTMYALADSLDYFFIYGPEFKSILPEYTRITGRPQLPPKWSFGLWMSKCSYGSQDEVLDIAKKLRENRIPCDVINIDLWHNYDFIFTKDFPDPRSMVEKLDGSGFKLSLWQHPYLIKGTKIYEEAEQKRYLALDGENKPYGDIGIIDLTNTDAVEWYKSIIKGLLDIGASVIKVDFGEAADENALYKGISQEEIHNLYPLLYNKALFEITEKVYGKGNGVIWARSAYAGSQRYPLHWSGDTTAHFPHLQTVLRSGLQFGLSGFVFWSHDIGGFLNTPAPGLYIRWAQFGLFCSHSRCHGTTPREPWCFGKETLGIFRKYDELRYSMLPYIYTQAKKCMDSSLPMVRALVLDYQGDKNVYGIDDEYMFGESILIAPILSENNRRSIYLPKGIWYDFWTQECLSGNQWIRYEASLDIMPMFIKKGSIIPFQNVEQYVKNGVPGNIKLLVWPDRLMETQIIDENTIISINGLFENGNLILSINDESRNYDIQVIGDTPGSIVKKIR